MILALAMLVGCAAPQPAPPVSAAASAGGAMNSEEVAPMDAEGTLNEGAVSGVGDAALRALLHDHWERTMSRSPVWATRLGDHRFDDQIHDTSRGARAADRAARDAFLARARGLSPASESDRVTLAMFITSLEDDAATDACATWQWGLSARHNALVSATSMSDAHPLDTPEDAANLLARFQQLPALFEAAERDLREGINAGRTPEAEAVRRVLAQVEAELALPPGERALTEATRRSVDWEGYAAWSAELSAVVEAAQPTVASYAGFLRDELLPAARPLEKGGVLHLPDGEVCYQALLRSYTTLSGATAEGVHQVGLDELEGIHAEFRELGARALGTDNLAAIFERMRTDQALYFSDADEVQAAAVDALDRARAALPGFFGRLPQADCGVAPIPAHEAPYTTIAYYQPLAPDGSRPGVYYVNTYAPETRPRHEAAVLAFHESIPGHHLQFAIANELPALPAFRRHMGMTAFVEGWALYIERLADEMGLYRDDLDRLGMLSFDAWRASRLVVDTGIHAFGWSREEAEVFMRENTPLPLNNITNEVDRYVTWPGQALAYKTGQIEIRDLRADAESKLGDAFDLADFHDQILGGGAMSLPLLRDRIEAWVASGGG